MSAVRPDKTLMPPKLKLEKHFQPCPVEPGDELYPNGMFEFNITRLLAFVDAHADRFAIEVIAVDDIPDYGGSGLDEEPVRSADLSQPILLAEIAPGFVLKLRNKVHDTGASWRDCSRLVLLTPTAIASRFPGDPVSISS
jgi:hypothetical protein